MATQTSLTRVRPTRISANIKHDGPAWSVEIPGDKVLFVGDNTEGKNRLLAALTLGCAGFVTEALGKDTVRDTGILMELGAGDGRTETLWACIDLDSGEHLRTSTEGMVGTAKELNIDRPAWVGALDLFPVHSFLDNVVGRSAPTVRRYLAGLSVPDPELLLSHAPKTKRGAFLALIDGAVALAQGDEKAQREAEEDALRTFRADPLAKVEAARTTLAERKKTLAAQIKGGDALLNSAHDMPAKTLADGWEADKAALAKHHETQRTNDRAFAIAASTVQEKCGIAPARILAEPARFTPEALDHMHATLATKLAEEQRVRTQAEAVLDAATAGQKSGSVFAQARIMREAIQVHVDAEWPACNVCGEGKPGLEGFQARAARFDAKVATLYEASTKVKQVIADAQGAHLEAESAVKTSRERLARIEASQKLIPALLKLATEKTIAEKAVTDATEAERVSHEAHVRWVDYEAARDNIDTWKVEQQEVEAMLGVVERMYASAASDDRARLVERVNQYLHDATFDLELSRGKRKDVRFGLVREITAGTKVLHTFLSGMETVKVYGAIGSALIRRGQRLAFVIPQDLRERDVSPKHLTDVMRGLSATPGCVYLFSTHANHGRTPAGWHVVNLADAFQPWTGTEDGTVVEASAEETAAPSDKVKTKVKRKAKYADAEPVTPDETRNITFTLDDALPGDNSGGTAIDLDLDFGDEDTGSGAAPTNAIDDIFSD